MPLYVFSEQPDQALLTPTPPEARPDGPPSLLAIDAWHAPMHCAPRECPRVCFWGVPTTAVEDRERFLSRGNARMIMAVEWEWLERLRTTTLYRYEVPDAPFRPLNEIGIYQTREPVVPKRVECIPNPLEALWRDSVELRVMPQIVPLGEAVMASTLRFSLLRMRGAIGWKG